MATYIYNQKRTRELQMAIRNALENNEVWFQPTHHGGCVQVLRYSEGSKTKTDYCINTFRSRNTGYRNFCDKLHPLKQDCLQLTEEWIDMILASKKIKFRANVRKGKVLIHLITIKNGGGVK